MPSYACQVGESTKKSRAPKKGLFIFSKYFSSVRHTPKHAVVVRKLVVVSKYIGYALLFLPSLISLSRLTILTLCLALRCSKSTFRFATRQKKRSPQNPLAVHCFFKKPFILLFPRFPRPRFPRPRFPRPRFPRPRFPRPRFPRPRAHHRIPRHHPHQSRHHPLPRSICTF